MCCGWLALDSGGLQAEGPDVDSAEQRARAALAQAEDAVRDAAAQRALWTTAQEALQDARAALKRNDYPQAERLAQFAAEQARLGIEQLGYTHFQ